MIIAIIFRSHRIILELKAREACEKHQKEI